jgi:hypothetical protein
MVGKPQIIRLPYSHVRAEHASGQNYLFRVIKLLFVECENNQHRQLSTWDFSTTHEKNFRFDRAARSSGRNLSEVRRLISAVYEVMMSPSGLSKGVHFQL